MLRLKCSIIILFIAFLIQNTSEEEVGAPEAKSDEIDLQESSDEAIGDRIMEEMNGMKVNTFRKIMMNPGNLK